MSAAACPPWCDPETCDRNTASDSVATALENVYQDTDRLATLRWVPVVRALLAGATLEQVADAMDEASDWVADRLLGWADSQEIAGRFAEDQGDALRELLHRAGGPAPVAEDDLPIAYHLPAVAVAG